jgi:crotonobetaine/carnitine-CoA ligase
MNWLLEMQAKRFGEKTLLTWAPFDAPARHYSYAEFYDLVGRLAAGLKKRGVKPGDRILVHLENCPEFLLSWFAVAECGAIAVTTNTRSVADELKYYIEHSGCSGAITQPSLFDVLQETATGLIKWVILTEHDNGAPPKVQVDIDPGDKFSSVLLTAPLNPRRQVEADPTRPIAVQYTSGTTSRPKGVLMTHANWLWQGRVSSAHGGLREDDVQLVYAPLFHVNALGYSFVPAVWKGATAVLMPRYSTSRFWSVACEHKTTWSSMMLFAMKSLADVEPPPFQPFRFWSTGAAGLEPATRFGIHLMGQFGMTETLSHPIVGFHDRPNEPGAMGRAAPEYGVRILDDEGRPAKFGEPGHLRIRGVPGVSIFANYLNNEKATKESFDDEGWFITGDRVIALENGCIRFADRDKDMLKVGGENVSASEIERVVSSVKEVAEVAVVAMPHSFLAEVPAAFVRLHENVPESARQQVSEQITAACKSGLADFKRPREIIFVEEFPRANLNKIAKAKLRAQFVAQ